MEMPIRNRLSRRVFIVLSFLFTTGMATDKNGCEDYYFWDSALDSCESCSHYCRNFQERDMEDECRELCPDYMKRQTAAVEQAENALDPVPQQFTSGLPDWALAVIIVTTIAVAVFAAVLWIFTRRKISDACAGWMTCATPVRLPTEESKHPERVSNDSGVNKLLPGQYQCLQALNH